MTITTTISKIKASLGDEEMQVKPRKKEEDDDEIVVPPSGACDDDQRGDESSPPSASQKKVVPTKPKVLEDESGKENDDVMVDLEAHDHAIFPTAFYCPITKHVMTDPVVHPSGDSFEKAAIVERQQSDQPLTFYPNRALRAIIEETQERMEEEGSVRGTIRKIDTSLHAAWDRLVEKTSFPLGESRPLPDEFYCPLTLHLPHEPIIDPEGNTYERSALVHWVEKNGDCPVTRKSLTVGQLRDNNAVLSILLEESEKPTDHMHPCIRRWKEEILSPPPSMVAETEAATVGTNNSSARALGGEGIEMNGTTPSIFSSSSRTSSSVSQQHLIAVYPTTREELDARSRGAHRASMISLLLTIVIISFALIYLPFYLVVFALAFCSCLYARRRFHEHQHRRR